MGPSFVEALPVERFHGVGPATAAKMKEFGIFTALDLRAKDESFLLRHFGKAGRHFYDICRGVDHRLVLPNRLRKSVGAENTFSRDLTSLDDMRAEIGPLVDKVWRYCDSTGARGRTVTLKVKFADFQIITRSQSRVAPISDRSTLASMSAELLAAQFPLRNGVRLIGVSLSSLCADAGDVDPQMALALSVSEASLCRVQPPNGIDFCRGVRVAAHTAPVDTLPCEDVRVVGYSIRWAKTACPRSGRPQGQGEHGASVPVSSSYCEVGAALRPGDATTSAAERWRPLPMRWNLVLLMSMPIVGTACW